MFDNESIRLKWEMKINHRNWREVYSKAYAMLTMASPGEVVCIVGASRIGKSKLVSELVKDLSGGNDFELTGILPVVSVNAVNTGPNGTFNTKSFTLRMLDAVKNPIYSSFNDFYDHELVNQKINRTTEAIFRSALERGLKIRKTRFLFIDETQHIRYAAKGAQAPSAIMDSHKCLAEDAEVVLVYIGAYPILDIIEKSKHLTGRKHDIHFTRYFSNDDDLHEFAKILLAYEEIMELHAEIPSLVEHIKMLHVGSLGCIGLLSAWLKRASAFALASNKKVTVKLLKETALSNSTLDGLASEIEIGEEKMFADRVDYSNKMILKNKARENNKKTSSNTSKPFQKKPVRMKPGNRSRGRDNEN